VNGVQSGNQYRSIRPNRKEGAAQIGHQTMLMLVGSLFGMGRGRPLRPYVWGVPAVPYRYYGDWGALWYPYSVWRGPHGGWGNP